MARTLTQKVTVAALVFGASLVIASAVAINGLLAINRTTNHLSEHVVPEVNANGHFNTALAKAIGELDTFARAGEDQDRSEVQPALAEAQTNLAQLDPALETDSSSDTAAQIELYQRRATLLHEVAELLHLTETGATTRSEALSKIDHYQEVLAQLQVDADTVTQASIADATTAVWLAFLRTSYSLAIALGLLTLLSVLAVFLLRRQIVRPINSLATAADAVASGALNQTVAVTSGDEIGTLQRAFNTMVANLSTQHATLEQRAVALAQATSEAQEARMVAEQASQLKSQFLANMSHELRTPLNAIINFTRFLSKERYGSLTTRQTELQQRVLVNADHLLGLINDILDLSKIESGRMELVYEELDLLPVLQSVMSTAGGLTKDKQIDLTLDVPPTLPLVRIDKTRIRQVLLNLLSNAAKFTHQGSITLRAHITSDQALCLAVQDTGIGIAPEHQAMVFEEFRQVQGELTRAYEGSGLGLSISKRLVELHGGRMWLESTPGVGSTFFFTLPVYRAVPALEPPEPEATLDPSRPLVVVVDDDPNAQQIFSHYLDSAGYSTCAVLDSRQALATIQQRQPDLVILDVLMPHFDGWEILTQLKSMPEMAAIPVIICSIVEEQQLGLALGAHAYLVKPVREEDFLPLVEQLAPAPTRILVIDDSADTQQIIATMLEGRGCQVVAAGDGVQGLEAVQDQRPDLIVLDLMMPRMDGFEVLERLRANPAHATIPVVVITAKELEPNERQWLLSRAQSCLQKNQLSTGQFVEYIHQVLGREAVDVDRS